MRRSSPLRNPYGTAKLAGEAVLLGCVYAVLSTPAAQTTSPGAMAAIIWPAPALGAALLWLRPFAQWPVFLAAIVAAMLWVGDQDALPITSDAAFALLNAAEVALFAFFGRKFVDRNAQIDSTAKLAKYIIFLPLLATAVVAAAGSAIGFHAKQTALTTEWRVLFVGNGLAVLVLLPALLAWCRRPSASEVARTAATPWLNAIVAAAGALPFLLSGLTTVFSAEVVRVFLSVVLAWAAIRGGFRAASACLLSGAVTGIGLTLLGYGAYVLPTVAQGVTQLQIDLAGLAILSFFIATVLEEREAVNARLERARRFEALGLLSGGIAHDFNNILGAVGGYAELAIERETAGLKVDKALAEVRAAVTRGKDLTDQILLAGRRANVQRQWVDLRNVLVESLRISTPFFSARTDLTVRLPLFPVEVPGNELQLTRALANLLRNAAHASNTTVHIDLRMPINEELQGDRLALDPGPASCYIGELLREHCVYLDVQDDGKGISQEALPQLFEPFFSSRESFKTASGGPQPGSGTGLGLAIVAGVAADHAGGVAVWSGPGQATIFRLILPIQSTQVTLQTGERSPKPMDIPHDLPLGNGELALVFADDRQTRELAENCLAELGFEPKSQGVEASLSPACENSLEIAILAVVAVQNQALREQIATRVRTANPLVSIILCTGKHAEPHLLCQRRNVTVFDHPSLLALQQAIKIAKVLN